MAKLVLLLVVILAIISTIHGGPLEDKRIRILQRKMTRMNRWLMGVQNGDHGCNDTIGTMADTVSRIAGLVDHLYKGPLLAKMDLSKGSNNYNKVLLKLPNAMEKCLETFEGTRVPRANAQLTCLQQIIWRYEIPVSARRVRRARNTLKRMAAFTTRSPVNLRVRKEYRALSDLERNRFHDALNALYQITLGITTDKDGTIEDFVIAHKGSRRGAHGGPAFLPWHRAFITSFENALDEAVPGVTLPYWDSSIDDKMDSPLNSKIWTHEFLGNGASDVNEGPFQDWVTPHGSLKREYGGPGSLVRKERIDAVMELCSFSDVSLPNAIQSIEGPHNGVHRWIGGDMSSTGTAPWDPVFYLHHCYIDYIWEKFRERQVNVCGVDPETDYDYATGKANHHFDDQMLYQDYLISEGMSNYWTQSIYRYEEAPSCANNCSNSDHLRCARWLNCCVPGARMQGPTDIVAFAWDSAGHTTTMDPSLVFASTTHCDHYLDPECHHEHSMQNSRAGIPRQPALELRLIEEMVPVNRGQLFPLDPKDEDPRSLQTLKQDMVRGIEVRQQWERAQRQLHV